MCIRENLYLIDSIVLPWNIEKYREDEGEYYTQSRSRQTNQVASPENNQQNDDRHLLHASTKLSTHQWTSYIIFVN